MLVADILHSCTDEGIAGAAVASIGGGFAARIRAEAARTGLSVGALTSSLVARFARDATERDWRDLAFATAGADQPVLSGLQAIAERMLARRDVAAPRPSLRDAVPPPRPAAPPIAFCCPL